jgi:Ca2+-binding RTX toxin-like protein
MATATNIPFPFTGDMAVDSSTNGTFWSLDGTRTVQWSISDGFEGEYWNNPSMVAAYADQALSMFSYYADIKFQYQGYFTDPATAYAYGSDINISLTGNWGYFPSSSIWATGDFPITAWETIYQGQSGDIFLNINSEANFLPSYEPGSAGWFLLLHELGHTVGLKHTHDDGGTGRPALDELGLGEFDKDWFSVMSYADDFNFHNIAFDPATPMALDVIGLQALYGVNRNTNATNTVYNVSDWNLYYTVWDAGGIDTVDASASYQGWVIALPDTQLSAIITEKFGFALPTSDLARPSPTTFAWLEGDIERATGSRYADQIYGNQLKNALKGKGGNDSLDGGIGTDTLEGGSGKDVFVFTSKLGTSKTDRKVNFDTIEDFSVKDDSLWLDNAIFKKLGSGTPTKSKQLNKSFFATDKATDKNDYLLYSKKTGVLSYDADGSGSQAAVEFAQLKKGLAMTYKDVFII